MNELKSNRCVVLLPPGDPHYLKLYEEVFARAIAEAGMLPYVFERSGNGPLPLDVLLQDLNEADALFADLSLNDAGLWFAAGCAFAVKKQVCLVSSRLEFSLPLDIRDLAIIPYPLRPFPSDYSDLAQDITEQLWPARPGIAAAESNPLPPVANPSDPFIAPSHSVILQELTSHEAMALTIIDLHASDNGLSPRDLGVEMQASGCAPLTSHAMNALKRRRFIERRSVLVPGEEQNHLSDNLFLTQLGEDWLIQHGKRKSLHRSNPAARGIFSTAR